VKDPSRPNTDPLVSVAVSTHQRPAGLRALIAALEAQTLPHERFEVVIVDDASRDETPAVLAEIYARSTLRLRTIRLDTNSGPAVGRNSAWRGAVAPIVAFTDDDCVPTQGWLEAGVRAMDAAPGVLVGATDPLPEQRHLIDPLARTMHVINPTFAPTCNVFYLRSDLESVGGFDETFRVPVGEDTDLAWRVHRDVGRELRFVNDALVYHDVRQRSFAQAVKETRRWEGVPPVVKRHPELARRAWPRRWLRPTHPRVILAAVCLLAAPFFPAAIVGTLPWLRSRVFTGWPTSAWKNNVRFVPAVFAIDLLEVWVLLRGSVRHRVFIF
jgi:glycosyltransferase involved in cell wall biosynthesis